MSERNTELWEWEQHMSPRKLAKFQLKNCRNVGKKYETWGHVWDAKHEDVVVGLLQLIYERLEKPKCQLEVHREYLANYHKDDLRLIKTVKENQQRILSMGLDAKLLRTCSDLHSCVDANYLSAKYRNHNFEYLIVRGRLRSKRDRLRKVKKVEHLNTLDGIGKKTYQKIMAAHNSNGAKV